MIERRASWLAAILCAEAIAATAFAARATLLWPDTSTRTTTFVVEALIALTMLVAIARCARRPRPVGPSFRGVELVPGVSVAATDARTATYRNAEAPATRVRIVASPTPEAVATTVILGALGACGAELMLALPTSAASLARPRDAAALLLLHAFGLSITSLSIIGRRLVIDVDASARRFEVARFWLGPRVVPLSDASRIEVVPVDHDRNGTGARNVVVDGVVVTTEWSLTTRQLGTVVRLVAACVQGARAVEHGDPEPHGVLRPIRRRVLALATLAALAFGAIWLARP